MKVPRNAQLNVKAFHKFSPRLPPFCAEPGKSETAAVGLRPSLPLPAPLISGERPVLPLFDPPTISPTDRPHSGHIATVTSQAISAKNTLNENVLLLPNAKAPRTIRLDTQAAIAEATKTRRRPAACPASADMAQTPK